MTVYWGLLGMLLALCVQICLSGSICLSDYPLPFVQMGVCVWGGGLKRRTSGIFSWCWSVRFASLQELMYPKCRIISLMEKNISSKQNFQTKACTLFANASWEIILNN